MGQLWPAAGAGALGTADQLLSVGRQLAGHLKTTNTEN